MPIGSQVIYNAGDLILSTVSSSGNTFVETKIAAATSSVILFNSSGTLTSASLNSTTVGTASYVSGSTSIITSITASNISASGAIIASSFTGSFSGSIINAVNAISASYALTSSYSTYTETSSLASFSQNAQDILLYVKNDSGQILQKGTVVRIVGVDNSSNVAKIQLADFSNEGNSANTLGFTNETFAINGFGYVMTEGLLTSVNTDGFTAGDLLYLSSSGTYTNVTPLSPLHGVRLGQAIRIQSNNGSIYVRIDNGAELEELHDVVDTTTSSSYGDLLVKSGSVWTNSKNLTGSYAITGSLNVTQNISCSVITSSFAYLSNIGFTNQTVASDTSVFPTGSVTGGFILDGGIYKNGLYRTRFVKIDRSANLPLYIQETQGSSGSFSNLARFGTHANSPNTFEVFGSTNIQGAITSSNFVGPHIGNTTGTASWATNASTASYVSPSGNAFVQGGNSFGTTALLGTNDAQSLALETNGTTRMSINSNGNVAINTSTSGLYRLNIADTHNGSLGSASLFITTVQNQGLATSANDSGIQNAYYVNNFTSSTAIQNQAIFNQLYINGSGSFSGSYRASRNAINISNTASLDSGGNITNTYLTNQISPNIPTFSIPNWIAGTGTFIDIITGNSTGSINNLYQHQIGSPFPSGGAGGITVNNSYGVYINKQKTTNIVTNGWGIYQADTGDLNIFAGKTRIGSTTVPVNTLDVTGNISASVVTASLFGTASWATNASTASYVSPSGNAFIQGGNSFGTTALLGTNDASALIFETNGTGRVTIDTNGNVGIGTTSPAFLLDVSGSSRHGFTSTNTHQFTGSVSLSDGLSLTNLTASNISASGNIIASKITASNAFINGNLTVTGSIFASLFSASYIYITSSTLVVTDNIITLNALSPYQRYAGIEMYDSGSGNLSSFLWDGQGDYFFVTGSGVNSKIIVGPDQQTNLTSGRLTKATGVNIIGDSIVSEDGNGITVSGYISGSSVMTANITCSNISASKTGSFGIVGIGTSSPISKLEVSGGYITAGNRTSPQGAIILQGAYDTGNIVVFGSEYSSGGPFLGYGVSPSTASAASFFSSTPASNLGRMAYVQGSDTHRWYVGAAQTVAVGSIASLSEAMRINSSGYVGIGTTNPSYLLHLKGGGIGVDRSNISSTAVTPILSVKMSGSSAVFNDIISIQNSTSADQSNLIIGHASGLGQSTFIGAGESATYASNLTGWGGEYLYLGADEGVVAVTNLQSGPAAAYYPFTISPNGSIRMQYQWSGSSWSGASDSYTLNVSGSNTQGLLYVQSPAAPNALFVSGSGNVGIGTTTPIQKLHVVGSTLITNNNYHYGYTLAGAQSNLIGISSADNILVGQSNVNHANTIIYGGLGVIDLNTSGSTRMRVTYDGNVGIGTTSPVTLLTVGSTTTTTSSMTLQGEYQSSVFNNTNIFNFRHGGFDRWRLITVQNSAASNDFDFRINSLNSAATDYNAYVTVKGLSGNVGIGVTNPSGRLHITASATNGEALVYLSKGSGSITQHYITAVNQLGQLNYRLTSDINGHAQQSLYLAGTIHVYHDSFWSSYINNANYTQGGLGIGTTSQTHGYGVTIARPATSGSLYVSGSSVFTGSVGISGSINLSGPIIYDNAVLMDFGRTTTPAISTNYVVLQNITGSYNAAFFDYFASSASNFRAGTVIAGWSGSSINYTEYATTDIGNTNQLTMSVDLSSSFVRLLTTVSTTTNWNIKSSGRYL